MLAHHQNDAGSGALMPLGFHFAASEPAAHHGIGAHDERRERLVTMFAASLAVMIVAAIAVLMGMA